MWTANDAWRHGKLASFHGRRLKIARRLPPDDGVLVVTIDEHEVHHLGDASGTQFSDWGVARYRRNQSEGCGPGRLSRVEEYAFCFGPGVTIPATTMTY